MSNEDLIILKRFAKLSNKQKKYILSQLPALESKQEDRSLLPEKVLPSSKKVSC